jgi:hypothetical protein
MEDVFTAVRTTIFDSRLTISGVRIWSPWNNLYFLLLNIDLLLMN